MKLIIPERQHFGPTKGAGVQMDFSRVNQIIAQGRAMTKIGNASIELSERIRKTRNASELYNRLLAGKQAYGTWYNERQMRQEEFATLQDESTEQLNAIGESMMEGIDDPELKSEISQKFGEYALTRTIEAQKTALDQEVNYHKSNYEIVSLKLRQEIAQADDPDEKAQMSEQGVGYLRELTEAGIFQPQDAIKREQAFLSGIVEDEVKGLIYNNPDAALRMLDDDKAIEDLAPDVRTRLIDSATKRQDTLLRQQIANMERSERKQEKMLQLYQDNNYAVLEDMLHKGQMDLGTLDQMRVDQKINGDQYRALLDDWRTIEEAGGPGNHQLFTERMRGVYLGHVGSITQAMTPPPGEEPLNREQIDQIMGELKQGPAAVQTSEYKNAAKYLEQMLGLFDSGPLAKLIGSHTVVATAAREMYLTMANDPNANPAEVANQLVSRYMGQYADLASSQIPIRYEDPRALEMAFNNGAISLDEYRMQAALMKLKNMGNKSGEGENESQNSGREDFSDLSTRKEGADGQ